MDEKKTISEAQRKAVAKYSKANYFQTLVRFPKDQEQEIRAAAGDSLNKYIVNAVLDQVARDQKTTKEERQELAEVQQLLDIKKADREKLKKFDL